MATSITKAFVKDFKSKKEKKMPQHGSKKVIPVKKPAKKGKK